MSFQDIVRNEMDTVTLCCFFLIKRKNYQADKDPVAILSTCLCHQGPSNLNWCHCAIIKSFNIPSFPYKTQTGTTKHVIYSDFHIVVDTLMGCTG